MLLSIWMPDFCILTNPYFCFLFFFTEHLKQRLDDYAALPKWQNKMVVVRNSRREGLIRTRIIGARQAKGEVLLWLDAHCEVGINWLPPLLAPIAQNR